MLLRCPCNRDGRPDPIEQAAEYAVFDELTNEKDNEKLTETARDEARTETL